MAPDVCTHLDLVKVIALPDPILGCEECLKIGGEWLHLRMCLTCRKIGCCDESPNRHATRHWRESEHALIRSAQPDEEWAWCFVDRVDLVFEPG